MRTSKDKIELQEAAYLSGGSDYASLKDEEPEITIPEPRASLRTKSPVKNPSKDIERRSLHRPTSWTPKPGLMNREGRSPLEQAVETLVDENKGNESGEEMVWVSKKPEEKKKPSLDLTSQSSTSSNGRKGRYDMFIQLGLFLLFGIMVLMITQLIVNVNSNDTKTGCPFAMSELPAPAAVQAVPSITIENHNYNNGAAADGTAQDADTGAAPSEKCPVCTDIPSDVDYDAVRAKIKTIIADPSWDDGSLGPVLVRLGWHASGTHAVAKEVSLEGGEKLTIPSSGGSNGACMRFEPDISDGANAGLTIVMNKLNPIADEYGISHSDLWILASYVAIEEMDGPKIEFTKGRTDALYDRDNGGDRCSGFDGRLPDAAQGAQHIRDVFGRMGFNDREMVALIGGGHSIGRAHTDRSGFTGAWTATPTKFTNSFFTLLLNLEWAKKTKNADGSDYIGPEQFENTNDGEKFLMLPADLALRDDADFLVFSKEYAKDQDLLFTDFAVAFKRLTQLGFSHGVKLSKTL